MTTWIILLIAVALGIYIAVMFNRLVRKRQMAREAWSGIDVQLKRRSDLVPRLVDIVKGYVAHERDVLTEVTQLRSAGRALPVGAVDKRGQVESAMSLALGRLMAVAEAYPDLKASGNFLDLQRDLSALESELQMARDNPGLQRALAAFDLGLRSEAVREWNYTTNMHEAGGMNDRALLAAAQLACINQVWDRCINTSERTKSFIDVKQRFPMPHEQAVLAQSKAIGLDPAYVYGLIRQESRFIMDARSHVGASGLMQVMPKTAVWTAKKIGMGNFTTSQLKERDVNIAIGTGYLKLVLDAFDGSMPMAAAAYNAGPSRSRSWRTSANPEPLEAAIWMENIPFSETRNYVKKVLANTTVYAAVISGQSQSLQARLGVVSPKGERSDVASRDLP